MYLIIEIIYLNFFRNQEIYIFFALSIKIINMI